MIIQSNYEKLLALTEDLFDHPELGYKEFRTSQAVEDYLHSIDETIEIEHFSTTGLKVWLNRDQTKELNVAMIAELDAVYAPSHFNSDPQTGAAHNCGHFTQVTVALSLFEHLFQTQAALDWTYNLCFIFIPAEEYLDLDYRRQLRDQGEITYLGGKPEAMALGVFDDIDLALSVHSIGERFDEPTIELNCDLAGFMYKYYTFVGEASHAGFDPFAGRNAYSMSTLFNNAVALSRQQIDETEKVRINPIIMQSDMSTNVIPNQLTVGTDIRTQSIDYLLEMSRRLDHAAQGSALALEGEVQIQSEMGYLPFVQDRYLSQMAYEVYEQYDGITHIIADRGAISAAGDIGDLSFMIPCIQISYGGFDGRIHGDDFRLIDPYFVLQVFPDYLVQVLTYWSHHLDTKRLYRRSFADYAQLIQQLDEGEADE